MVQVWSGTDQVCPSLTVVCFSARFGTCSAAICQEDLTPPPLPVSSICSLLSGGTKGAGFNYGKEVDCDTDTGCGDGLFWPGWTGQALLCSHILRWWDHLLPLPFQQSWTNNTFFYKSSSQLTDDHFVVSSSGPYADTFSIKEKYTAAVGHKDICKLN